MGQDLLREAEIVVCVKGQEDRFEFRTIASYELLPGQNIIKIVHVEPIIYEGHCLNFKNVPVNIETTIDSKCYACSNCELTSVRSNRGIIYKTDTLLRPFNRRGAYRVNASYKAVVRRVATGGVTEERLYDISHTGVGLLVAEDTLIEVGDTLAISVFAKKDCVIKVSGEVKRKCPDAYCGKCLLGIELNEKGIPAEYSQLVNLEQAMERRNDRGRFK